jgi:Zn-dependent membrane protease YugP
MSSMPPLRVSLLEKIISRMETLWLRATSPTATLGQTVTAQLMLLAITLVMTPVVMLGLILLGMAMLLVMMAVIPLLVGDLALEIAKKTLPPTP